MCSGCQTLYHHECFEELGGCSTLGCPRKGLASSAPTPARAPRRSRGCGSWRALAELSPSIELEQDGAVRLDITTLRERISCFALAIFVPLTILPFGEYLHHGKAEDLAYTVTAFLALVLSGAVLHGLDDVVLIDPQQGAVYLRRSFFKNADLTRICGFSDVRFVRLAGTRHENKGEVWWTWQVGLKVASRAEPVWVTDPNREEPEERRVAESLAELLGVEVRASGGAR